MCNPEYVIYVFVPHFSCGEKYHVYAIYGLTSRWRQHHTILLKAPKKKENAVNALLNTR